jgi:ABC-type transport system substrate-binding protein
MFARPTALRCYRLYLFSLLVVLLLAACSPTPTPPPDQPAPTPQAGGGQANSGPAILRIGWPGSPDTLNPAAAILSEAYTLFELTYDTMFDLQLELPKMEPFGHSTCAPGSPSTTASR